ncbi:MAG: hypothetical protein DRI89_11755 [Bacteroidetes bacterium]|nr:MAG: hypothetical protein DRI89_11755 [Bacteroidota bacterium]
MIYIKKIIALIIIFNSMLIVLKAQKTELSTNNSIIKVKLDLSRGGAINYISLSGTDRNLVNIYDEGRYIQQSFYAGKSLDRTSEGQSSRWSPWSWNPIQVGDAFGNRAQIIDFQKHKDTLYVKCIPMLWDMNNKPAKAVMEQWTILNENVIEVRNKLTCLRTDSLYEENILNDQELPAVYPISALHKLYFYEGKKPFINDTLSNPPAVNLSSGFWGRYHNISEHWMAFVNDDGFGMGVYNPQCTYFLAGMSGKPNQNEFHSSTSYIAPVKKEILNRNTVYEYTYYIVIGQLDEIREKVYELNINQPE